MYALSRPPNFGSYPTTRDSASEKLSDDDMPADAPLPPARERRPVIACIPHWCVSYMHVVSGCLHVASGDDKLLCGRKLSDRYFKTDELDMGRPHCKQCWAHTARWRSKRLFFLFLWGLFGLALSPSPLVRGPVLVSVRGAPPSPVFPSAVSIWVSCLLLSLCPAAGTMASLVDSKAEFSRRAKELLGDSAVPNLLAESIDTFATLAYAVADQPNHIYEAKLEALAKKVWSPSAPTLGQTGALKRLSFEGLMFSLQLKNRGDERHGRDLLPLPPAV